MFTGASMDKTKREMVFRRTPISIPPASEEQAPKTRDIPVS